MVSDIEMADCSHDDPDYMEDAMRNKIDEVVSTLLITMSSCRTI